MTTPSETCPIRPGAAAALAALCGALLALPTLRSYFVADDLVSLYSVTTTAPWRYLYSNWLGAIGEGGFYRPVFNWALGLCWLPLGLHPVPFRLAMIGLFALNCALVVRLAHRSSGSAAGALAAGLVFAAHPVHGEAIGWISALLEQLCAVFFLLAILSFDRAAAAACGADREPAPAPGTDAEAPEDPGPRRKARRWLALSLGLMALSLGSKEMGIAIPAVAVLWDLALYRERWALGGLLRGGLGRLRLWLPLGALAVAYVLFRLAILGGVGGYGERHLRFDAADNHLVHYLGFLVEPLPSGWLDRGAGGKALAVVAAAFAGLWALARQLGLPGWRGAALGVGWFLVTWAPVSTLLRPQYLFLPSVGAALVVAGVLGPLLDEARRRGQSGLSLAVALALAAWMLVAGNTLLAQLKRWEQGGQIAESVLRQSAELLAGAPAGTVVLYEKLPINIGVPVFQHGIQEGLRLYLGRDDLVAARVRSFDPLPPFVDPWRARFFSYEGGRLHERTGELRARRTQPTTEPAPLTPEAARPAP